MQTRDEYLEEQRSELGADFREHMIPHMDNEYYAMVEQEVRDVGFISQGVYDSLSPGQQHHFNKHYNHRGDRIH